MINTDFHNILGPYSVETLSNMINAKMYNVDNQRLISGAADVENAKKGDITFIVFNNTLEKLNKSNASACIIRKYDKNIVPNNMVCLEVKDPHAAYAMIAQKFYPKDKFIPKVSPNADVLDKYKLSNKIRIDPYVVIEENAVIDDYVWIGSGSYIGKGVKIGYGTRIHSKNVQKLEKMFCYIQG